MPEKPEKPTPNLVQPQNEKALIHKYEETFTSRLNAMREHYRQWQLNLAFVRGRQWCTYDRLYGKITDLRPRGANRSKVVFNLIGPFVRSTLSMLSQSHPTMDVIPASYSSKDEHAAKSAQVHLDRIDIINKKTVNDILLRKLVLDYGTGFKLEYWDSVPNMEDMNESPPGSYEELVQMGKPPEKIPLTDETEEQRQERLDRGECAEIICSPFEVLLDYPLVKKDSDIRDFIRYRVVSLDYIRTSYKRGIYVQAEDVSHYGVLNEIVNTGFDLIQGVSGKSSDRVVLKEYYFAPHKGYPQGRNVHWAAGIMLHDGVLSHPKGKLGLVSYHWSIDPNDFYGESYVQPLIEPQVIINRIFSKLTDWLGKSVRFRVAVPKNAQFSKVKFQSANDGDVFEYNGAGGLGAINLPVAQIPPGIFDFLNATIQNFRDLASRHEVSKGEVPGRVESSKAIRSLQEADSQYLIPAMIVWEERERECALFKLDLMREYYKAPREVRILGEMRKVELYKLSNVDLSAGIDINVVRGSAMPKSRVAQTDFIIGLYQFGLLGDPEDPALKKRVMRWIDVGGIQGMYGAVEIGANLQQMEFIKMRRGEYVEAQSFHDHYTHNEECLKELNSPDFIDRPQEYQDMVIRHWQQHRGFIAEMNVGLMPGMDEQPTSSPMPGAGGKLGLPEGVNPAG